MRKDGKIKISYAVAAGVLLGSVSMTSLAKPWRIGAINRASQSDGRLHTDADTLVSDAERFLRQRTGTKDGGHRIGHIPPASCASDCPVSAITQGREKRDLFLAG